MCCGSNKGVRVRGAVAREVVGGPDWRNQTTYAIEAQSQQPATQLQFQAMLRTLLEEVEGFIPLNEDQAGDCVNVPVT